MCLDGRWMKLEMFLIHQQEGKLIINKRLIEAFTHFRPGQTLDLDTDVHAHKWVK